jgi:Zn-dependent protease
LRSQLKLGRIAGIQIGLHYSWFIIALLIAFSLASHFRALQPGWGESIIWVAAIVTSCLFFVTLLLHELAHSLVAKSLGLRVRAITLFALGGVSQIESEASDAKSEFWIAVVGPLTSLVIGGILVGLARLTGSFQGTEPVSPIGAISLWLGYINLALAGFNMIPGYPLDGGRVLRAIIWWVNKDAQRATKLSAQVGQVVAGLFILYGFFRFFVGANVGGLWMAFIGWFLLDAARSSYTQVGIVVGLREHSVSDLMQRDCGTVESYISVRDFVDQYVVHSGTRCFLVAQGNHIAGLVTDNDTVRVPRANWDQTSVQSIMRPLSQLRSVAPEMPALKALELMARENLNQLAVVSNGELQGIFSRGQVLRFLQFHSGIGEDTRNAA